jgi:LytS/YehU family sensor histidine kinase
MKLEEIEKQKSQMEIRLTHSKMNILKAQMQPEFVFSTLKNISALIDIDGEKSQNLIADFGDLFRSIIDTKEEDFIGVEDELKFLKKYIAIVSVGFFKKFIFNKKINKNLEELLIPNRIIQPIIQENLNLFSKDQSLMINLTISKLSTECLITIQIIGKFILITENVKINDKSIIERLHNIYQDNYTLTTNLYEGEINSEIKIPITND